MERCPGSCWPSACGARSAPSTPSTRSVATGCCSCGASSRPGSPSRARWRGCCSRWCSAACWCGPARSTAWSAGSGWCCWPRPGSVRWCCSCRAGPPAPSRPRPSATSVVTRWWLVPSTARTKVAVDRNIEFRKVAGRRLKLDVYRPAGDPEPGARRPAVLQIHGGAWVIGDKREQGIPLLRYLAARGWVGLQRELPAEPGGDVPGPPRRRQGRAGLDPGPRRRVRHRSRLRGRHRRLGRRAPHRADGADGQRRPLPARLRARRHVGAGRAAVLRGLRLHQPQRHDGAGVPELDPPAAGRQGVLRGRAREVRGAPRRSTRSTPTPRRS